MKNYYPEISDTGNSFITILRKEKDGVWYDWIIQETYSKDNMEYALKRINKFAYYTIILGEVNPELVAAQGYNIFQKCENQQSEKERLTKLII